jgi:hypothetical protein
VIRDLQRDVEREAVDRALVAEQLVKEIHLSRPPSALGVAPLTDSVLERVSELAGVDVDLYVGGELLATSKPELVASGFSDPRAPAAAGIVVSAALIPRESWRFPQSGFLTELRGILSIPREPASRN